MTDLREGEDGPRGDGLGPEHVRVDDIGPHLAEVGGQGTDRDRVVDLIDV